MSKKTWLKHITNPLHVYCRLRDLGVSKDKAKQIGRLFEQFIYPLIKRVIGK